MGATKALRTSWLGIALLSGALWGVCEATAGHLFHLARIPGAAGLVMFPIGFLWMARSYAGSGRYGSILLTACVAASVKLADLFLPVQDPFTVINPAQAILLESLAVVGIFAFAKAAKSRGAFVPLAASFSWRLVFVAVGTASAGSFGAPNLFAAGIFSGFGFLVVEPLVNGFLIFAVLRTVDLLGLSPRLPVYE